MKRTFMAFLLIATCLIGCVSTSANFEEVTGKDWLLTEVRVNGVNSGFNRSALINEGFRDAFTINFDEQTVSGVGAPNRYSAPYSLKENQTISIMPARQTLMAALFEPTSLKEHDFFVYIGNIYKWKLANNRLELNSKTQDGREVLLVFSQQ
ncbi:MAG: META domain-containing protein [Treponema sp.]|nr:META domain-containing protein [Treponema sp.]